MGQRFKAAFINIAKNLNDLVSTGIDYDGYAVTPADGTLLVNGPTRAIFVTGTGNVAGTLHGGGTFVLTSVPANTIVPIAATIIASTSTTATGISALY
jgi:hypothetical protein